MLATSAHVSGEVSTLVPARLERLPWGRFHVLVIAALGITWILDGLEVTLAGSVAPALKESPALRFSDSEVGLAGSAYLLGAVVGALFFGWLTDRLGRKKLFFTTIVVYLIATALTGLAWNGFSFFLFRFFTGCGIGGEYSAINSTIQELVPGRYRGQLDLTINGSFWVGAALGAVVAVVLLNPALIPSEFGWRLAFLTGAILGVVLNRRHSRRRRFFHAQVDSREPALASDPRAGQGGRGHCRGDRKAISEREREARAGPRRQSHPLAHARPYPACRSVRHAGPPPPAANLRRAHADGGAG